MSEHHHINYIEFAAHDLPASKHFFSQVFNWQFTDYGPDYSAFENSGIAGGFYRVENNKPPVNTNPLVVIYSSDLIASQQQVIAGGGTLVKEIFSFPGGQRFEFVEPSGNRLAVWSE